MEPHQPPELRSVRVRAPSDAPLAAFLEATGAWEGTPFAQTRRAALNRLSLALLRDPLLRQDPAAVAVAFWLRASHVERMAAAHAAIGELEPNVIRVPAGRVFHVAPANVDTLFVYSWALSFLCGNANVVRVPSHETDVVAAMLDCVSREAEHDPDLANANLFVSYEHDDAVTTTLSRWCSHRVIWGGNETTAALRALPLNPHASERLFGSKFSTCAVRAEGYLAADNRALEQLASAFFNDVFWFDQMACSSPQVVFWVGGAAEAEAAVRAFSSRLQLEVERRAYRPGTAEASHRRLFAFDLVLRNDARVDLSYPGFVNVSLAGPSDVEKVACGGGLLRHLRVDALDDLLPLMGEADQTVTHFGFPAEELRAFARRAGARGVDRLVPIGEALAFSPVWDGYDLLDDFLRKVTVR